MALSGWIHTVPRDVSTLDQRRPTMLASRSSLLSADALARLKCVARAAMSRAACSRVGRLSWLTILGHAKVSLWSVGPFRCESVALRTHWALVVMGQ